MEQNPTNLNREDPKQCPVELCPHKLEQESMKAQDGSGMIFYDGAGAKTSMRILSLE
jgi:hypothetical protein